MGTLGPNQYSFAYGINDVGQAVGASQYDAVLFEKGHVTEIGTVGCPVGGADDIAYDINDAGQIAGTTCYRVGRPIRAVLWDHSTISDLGTLHGGTWAEARAINGVGQIAGTSELRPYEYYAVIWENAGITNLGALPGATLSMAYDINDAGQVVGFSNNPPGRAVLWENGKIEDLGTLSGGDSAAAYGINNHGQIVGVSRAEAGGTCCWEHAFIWEGGTMTDLGTLGGRESEARGINDAGQIVGSSQNASGYWHAFLWERGTMTDLGTLPALPPWNEQSHAFAINDAGRIVGTSEGSPYGYHAVLWAQPPVHDVSVKSAASSPLSGTIGTPITISAVVENTGSETEAFDVRAFAGAILVGTQKVVDLGPGESVRLFFAWDASNVLPQLRQPGSYPTKVVVAPLPQEIDTADNEHAAGTVILSGSMWTHAEPIPDRADVGPTVLFRCRVGGGPSTYTSPSSLMLGGTTASREPASGDRESHDPHATQCLSRDDSVARTRTATNGQGQVSQPRRGPEG